jgi:type I restriction enzyme, R subunit
MTPEEARREIDAQLARRAWLVQDYRRMNISPGPGVAIREFPLSTGDHGSRNPVSSSVSVQ